MLESTRGRRRWIRTAPIVALVVTAAVGTMVVRNGDGAEQIEQVAPPDASEPSVLSDSTASSSVGSATPQPAPTGAAPRVTVVLAGDGRLVALDTLTGEIVRELRGPPTGGSLGDPSLSPDGAFVYFAEWPGAKSNDRVDRCRHSLHRTSIESGETERVADGVHGEVSPDGRYLAYVASGVARGLFDTLSPGFGCGLSTVVVRDLRTGEEWQSVLPGFDRASTPDVGVSTLAWSPDSTRVAYDLVNEGGWTFVFDIRNQTTRRLEIAPAIDHVMMERLGGPGVLNPRWTTQNELLVSLSCYGCMLPALTGVVDNGAVISALTAPRALNQPTLTHDGWSLVREWKWGTSLLDVAVIAPNGTRTVIATDIREAAWADPDPMAPAFARYTFDIAPVAPSRPLEIRNNSLVQTDADGHASVVFTALAPLTELVTTPDLAIAYVVEQTAPSDCTTNVWRIPLHGGLAVPMLNGTDLSLSPDGARLALRKLFHNSATTCARSMEVVDVATGQVRRDGWVPAMDGATVAPSISAATWAPDSTAMILATREGDLPWIYRWTFPDSRITPTSVRHVAGGNISPRSDPDLDAIFGQSMWGLANPRFEGPSLVADVVCLSDERCGSAPAYQVRGGEGGVFDAVIAT